jgi:hypothetical protein
MVGHRDRPAMLSNLAIALQIRFGRTGEQADLDRAITIGRQAVDITCACRKPMRPGDTRESRLRRGYAAGPGSGPGR